jgi:hypothetical protein
MILQVQRKDCEEKLRQYEERAVAAEKAQKTAEDAAKIRYCGQYGTVHVPTVLSLDGDTKFSRIQCCGSIYGRIVIIWPDQDRHPVPADRDKDLNMYPFKPNVKQNF